MNKIEPDYNYQVTTSGRGYGKTFFQNRIKQAYKSGKEESFRERDNLIKYLEEKIQRLKDECASLGHIIDKDTMQKFDLQINVYQDILERLKSGKYE